MAITTQDVPGRLPLCWPDGRSSNVASLLESGTMIGTHGQGFLRRKRCPVEFPLPPLGLRYTKGAELRPYLYPPLVLPPSSTPP